MRRPFFALAVVAVLFASSRARAADPPAPDPAPAEDDPEKNTVVVTGTRTTENAKRSLVRVDVVQRDEATKRGATNVGEALSGEAGLQVNPSAYGAIGNPSAAQMSGLDRERILVLEDGERVVGDVGGAVDLSQISLAGVQRVELVRGPTSALYGTSALGGVINVVSGPPPFGLSERAQLEGRYRWGGQALGEISYRAGDAWVSGAASFYGAQRLELDPPDTAIPDLYRASATLRGGVDVTENVKLFGKIRYGREASLGLDSQAVPGLGTYLIDLPEVTDRLSILLRSDVALGPGHSLTVSAAKQWFWNETSNDRRDSPLDDVRDRFHTMQSIESTGAFFDGKIVSFVVGSRAEAESFHQDLARSTVANGQVQHIDLVEVEPTTLITGALYAQVRFDPIEELSLLVGGRLEASPRYGAAGAPRFAIAARPALGLTLRASVGRGYRAPTAKEIGFVFDHAALGYRVIGNPDLDPETSWGFTADAEYRFGEALTVKAGGFANWVSDLIDLRFKGKSTVAGVDDYTYLNVGKATTSGLDFSVLVRATPWLRVDAAYAYLFTRDEEALRPLPGRPPHTLACSFLADTPIGLSLYARARVVTDAYIEDTIRAPAFGTLDLRVAQRLWPRARAYAGVLNVLGAQKDPSRIGDQRPLEGRTFYLGIEADFPSEE
ncbi:MAG: TonB-dependent receptor [Polyangiaceae bacterium]